MTAQERIEALDNIERNIDFQIIGLERNEANDLYNTGQIEFPELAKKLKWALPEEVSNCLSIG